MNKLRYYPKMPTIHFKQAAGSRFFMDRDLSYLDLNTYLRGATVSFSIVDPHVRPYVPQMRQLQKTGKDYFSICLNTWLPLDYCYGGTVMVDMNILVDIEKRRAGYLNLINMLSSAEQIVLQCATLENVPLNNSDSKIAEKEHLFYTAVLNQVGLTKVSPFSKTWVEHAFLKFNELAELVAFVQTTPYGLVKKDSKRIDSMKAVLACARDCNVPRGHVITSLVLQTLFQQDPELNMFKHTDVTRYRNNPATLSRIIQNIMRDINYIDILQIIWEGPRRVRFLTADRALALHMLTRLPGEGKDAYYDQNYLFPDLSPEEWNCLKLSHFIRTVPTAQR